MTEIRNCPLCSNNNSKSPRIKYSEAQWDLKTCSNCGFTYLENAPEYSCLEEEYAWEKTSQKEEEARIGKSPLRKKFSSYMKVVRDKVFKRDKLIDLFQQYEINGNVLDIGCATGDIFYRLAKTITPFGVEISKYLADIANKLMKPRRGYTVSNNAVDGCAKFPDDFFDAAILSAFLEHEVNPEKLLKNLHNVLKENGLVVIKVPNYNSWMRIFRQKNWSGFRYPDHVNYFTPASMTKLITKCGYSIKQFGFFDRFPLNDNLWIVIQKKS